MIFLRIVWTRRRLLRAAEMGSKKRRSPGKAGAPDTHNRPTTTHPTPTPQEPGGGEHSSSKSCARAKPATSTAGISSSASVPASGRGSAAAAKLVLAKRLLWQLVAPLLLGYGCCLLVATAYARYSSHPSAAAGLEGA